jgi:hypothetical protein
MWSKIWSTSRPSYTGTSIGWEVRRASSAKACCVESVYMYVSGCQRINTSRLVTYNKLSPNIPFYKLSVSILQTLGVDHTGIQVINSKPSNPCCEAFVQPQLIPPVHGDKVTKPLMSELVSNNVCDPVAVAVCRRSWVEQHCGGSVPLLTISSHISHVITDL